MDKLTTLGEDRPCIPEELAPNRAPGSRWRSVRRVGGAGVAALVALVIGLGIASALRESRREQCVVRLKRLGLALHAFHDVHGHFPAPALPRRDGTPLLSWRVALLPHLGYRSLYERFHLEEPWDSPHNRTLIAEMPAEFACPGGPGRREGRTGYQVVVGPKTDPTSVNTPFEPTRGVDLREMTDGTSNTILVAETVARVPWTKPDDLRWKPGGPLPRLASPHLGGSHVLFADGSTRFLKPTISAEVLLGILTINGGEILSA